jgi:chemotaxis protein MotB
MERQSNAAPVIIKRRRGSQSEDHHGGAWKIAFADFATAMMAFFLVMWLINATDDATRRGLAKYFSPTIAPNESSAGGDGTFGGHNVLSEELLTAQGRQDGSAQAEGRLAGPDTLAGTSGAAPDAEPGTFDTLEELARRLRGRGGESTVSELALRHVITRVTDEGLIVEVFDLPDQPLFVGDGDEPMPVLPEVARLVAEVFGLVENGIALEGHLRALPLVLADSPVWDMSTARAQRMRELLEAEGLASERMRRVTGHADRQPATRNPAAVRNNRLELILLHDRG